jgi:para-nitrobenzyl esterase
VYASRAWPPATSRRQVMIGLAGMASAPAAARAQGGLFRTVETSHGRVEGLAQGGVVEFKGIPYGAPTGGRNRFMPPQAPARWTGVRECHAAGQAAPQAPADFTDPYIQITQWDRNFGGGGVGEDCLSLSVWTPSVDRGAKRAVMVSLHGGGFYGGSGNAQLYDGKFLAAYGDVVVVTVNHRLGSFGHTYLAGVGAPDRFRYAGVAGILDLVAALQWVRENIEGFGGDPGRVMIFGDSGGGRKTSILMGAPSAKGLFHRAAVQSGSVLRLQTEAEGAQLAEELLRELGINKSKIGDLQTLPWKRILEAQIAVGARRFMPSLGTAAIPDHPFDPKASELSADVPLIVSTCLEDAGIRTRAFDLDEAGLRADLEKRFPGRASDIIALYRRRDPGARPFFIQAQVLTDTDDRPRAQAQALRKAALGRAPAYMYEWRWRTPVFGGEMGAIHGCDVPASFHSYRDAFFAGSARGKVMADRLATAWVAFAKTGDPNNSLIPHWPAFEPQHRSTMVFDDDTRVEDDPRAELRAYWDANPPLESQV